MACSRPVSPQDGYATPAAVVISLALAIVATAVSARSIATLKLAQGDLDRTKAEYALAGAQQTAAAAFLAPGQTPSAQWSMNTDIGAVDVLAEPEAPKLSLAAAADLDGSILAKFRVTDPAALRARLKALAEAGDAAADLEDADAAPLWTACARSLISADGLATAPRTAPLPAAGSTAQASGHLGEVWRIQVASSKGWVDDRTVRFAGDPLHPAATIRRRFSKGQKGVSQCDAMLRPNPAR